MQTLNLSDLKGKNIDEVIIYPTPYQQYGIRVVIENQYYSIYKESKSYIALSIGKIYEDFDNMKINAFTLIENNAYDEMIGLPETSYTTH